MKVLGIVCSPRKGGNTELLMQEALAVVREAGAETELVSVIGKKISPCDACASCRETGKCKINDDMQPIYQQMEAADAIILGTPVYFMNVSAQMKTIMDRTYMFLGKRDAKMREPGVRRLRDKVAGGIVVTRRVGAGQVKALLSNFFLSHGMITANIGIGYGRDKGEVKQGAGGGAGRTAIEEAREVGNNVIRMLKMLGK
ncbi:MAG: flavodoxin family protein [Chloroflexota bacterium]